MIADHDRDRQSRDFQNMIVSDRRSWFGKMIVSDRRSRKKVSCLTLLKANPDTKWAFINDQGPQTKVCNVYAKNGNCM